MTPRPTDDPSPASPAAPPLRKTILVVDDELDLVELITYNLQRNGYQTLAAHDGPAALEQARQHLPDLVLLDLMLPGLDGHEVARRLKSDPRTAAIPILMLTARSEETDVVVGLTLGADDYITKPFSTRILLARVATLLRRTATSSLPQPADPDTLRAGPLAIDLARHEASLENRPLRLTLTEFKLLKGLVEARGRVLSRDQLMDKGMGTDVFVTDRAIDVHITAIRKKLGRHSYLVHTVRGVGYRLQESPNPDDDPPNQE